MVEQTSAPALHQVVLDTTDARALAEFYRSLLGWNYRAGDEPPAAGQPDPRGQDWLVLRNPSGGVGMAFQQVHDLPETTWPDDGVPQQAHLDMTVPTMDQLESQHARALSLGARLRSDRSDDPVEPLRVYADPAGHLLCIFVAAH
jgi:catechol 2,3-dioxygenase-like lactoylglutathione lyase family enzyme